VRKNDVLVLLDTDTKCFSSYLSQEDDHSEKTNMIMRKGRLTGKRNYFKIQYHYTCINMKFFLSIRKGQGTEIILLIIKKKRIMTTL